MDKYGCGPRTAAARARPWAALVMVVSAIGVSASPARADVVAVGGGAFGISAGSFASPQPAVSFTNPPDGPGPFTASAPSVSLPTVGAGIFASNVQVATEQVGTIGSPGAGSHSSVDLGNVAYLTGPIAGRSVHSECSATAGAASGSTTFGTLNYFQNQGIIAQANFSPAPNTTVNTGLGVTLVLNEQTLVSSGPTTGIVVNAMRITDGGVDIVVGQSRCTVTDVPGVAHTTLSVTPDQVTAFESTSVTFTYTEVNDGTHPIANVTLNDDQCSPVSRVGGDTNGNDILDPGETWIFECLATFFIPGSFTSNIIATGTDTVTGLPHVEQASAIINVFMMGFWDPVTGMWIDPSGTICASSAATVTLFRSDTPGGPFQQVPAGSTIMSPANRANPDTPRADGSFRWDVVAGFYKIRLASLDGSESVDSDVFPVPPEVTGLSLRLRCPSLRAPVATPTSGTLALTGGRGLRALGPVAASLIGLGFLCMRCAAARRPGRRPFGALTE